MTLDSYTPDELEALYREAAQDRELEAEALVWIEADLDEAPRRRHTASGSSRPEPISAGVIEATGQ